MPLIYNKAEKIWKMISRDFKLAELERSGFVKCVARKTCLNGVSHEERIRILRESLIKQFKDFEEAEYEDRLEALADIRNVAGLLFLALKEA
jgi:hypothetical protein